MGEEIYSSVMKCVCDLNPNSIDDYLIEERHYTLRSESVTRIPTQEMIIGRGKNLDFLKEIFDSNSNSSDELLVGEIICLDS